MVFPWRKPTTQSRKLLSLRQHLTSVYAKVFYMYFPFHHTIFWKTSAPGSRFLKISDFCCLSRTPFLNAYGWEYNEHGYILVPLPWFMQSFTYPCFCTICTNTNTVEFGIIRKIVLAFCSSWKSLRDPKDVQSHFKNYMHWWLRAWLRVQVA